MTQVTGNASRHRGFIVYSLYPVTSPTSPTERVGRYQLLDPIGIGPSGTVSRAKVFGVAGFERQFAVKRFHAELTATAAMAAMLSAAARAYGSLEHPRIARMSEFGIAQGSTFTAVEYVHGLDALRLINEARLAGASLAAGGALALVSQAARAVGYAHGRGLTHLGLAPTNVIITAEGDIKITDFGILSATLPPRPIDVARLAQRIPYLAPEQLANEATSAATDVFALGVLAYELVTGNRTFKGETPQQIASAIMAGPPAEPLLPRPIVRVLQRCLARSPFERFPDARALADALDAALRVAPVPGTRKDIGVQVKDTLDRLAALNEGQMSGMVALHFGTGPIRRPDEVALEPPDVSDAGDSRRPPGSGPHTLQTPPASAYELAPADLGAMAGPATTLPDLPRQPMTVPGLPPPPIPVPPGVGGSPASAPQAPSASNTLLGLGGKTPPAIPAVKVPRAASPTGLPSRPPAVPAAALRPRAQTDLSIPLDPESAPPGQGLTVESAIHPLDPGDLVPFEIGTDAELDDGVAPDAARDAVPPDAAAPDLAAPHAGEPGALELSDQLLGFDAGAPPPALALESPSRRPTPIGGIARPDTPETRPTVPSEVATPLFDPIVRSTELPTLFNVPANPMSESDHRSEDAPDAASPAPERPAPEWAASEWAASEWSAPEPAAPEPAAPERPAPERLAPERLDPAAVASWPAGTNMGPAADPRLGKTMLGFGAPPLSRPATPAPQPSSNDPASAGDELSAMALEDFRAPPASLPAQAVQPAPAWQHDGFTPHPGEPPPNLPPAVPGTAAPVPPAIAIPPPLSPPVPMSPHGAPLPMLPHGAPPMPMPMSPHGVPTPMPWGGGPATGAPTSAMSDAARPRRTMWILVGMLGAVVVAIAGWQIYLGTTTPSDTPAAGGSSVASAPGDRGLTPTDPRPATVTSDATEVATTTDATSPPSSDAAQVATATPTPASGDPTPASGDPTPTSGDPTPTSGNPTPAPGDATVTPPAAGDMLSISSTPPGARVYLDGSDAGVTPVKLRGSPDRHTIALLLAGHDLYVAEVDGRGTFQIPLKEVTPTSGPAGIKVLRCKAKERYYVFVDEKPTGQTCPTERIGTEMGPHTVEVYDAVTETRRKWDIVVKETRLSFRVRVE
jgi:serine/threonine protein kinase